MSDKNECPFEPKAYDVAYVDEEGVMVTVIHHETPTARKEHHCDECGQPIEPGTQYIRQRNCDGGDIWTYKAHVDCWESAIQETIAESRWRPTMSDENESPFKGRMTLEELQKLAEELRSERDGLQGRELRSWRDFTPNFSSGFVLELVERLLEFTWIPVSERLPAVYTWVLVTSHAWPRVCLVFFRGPNSFDESVVAWMPLPEPYLERSKHHTGERDLTGD